VRKKQEVKEIDEVKEIKEWRRRRGQLDEGAVDNSTHVSMTV